MIPGGWAQRGLAYPAQYPVPALQINPGSNKIVLPPPFSHLNNAIVQNGKLVYDDIHSWARFKLTELYLAGVYLYVEFVGITPSVPLPEGYTEVKVSFYTRSVYTPLLLTSRGEWMTTSYGYLVARIVEEEEL